MNRSIEEEKEKLRKKRELSEQEKKEKIASRLQMIEEKYLKTSFSEQINKSIKSFLGGNDGKTMA